MPFQPGAATDPNGLTADRTRIIYDIGCNLGQDLGYFLAKADRVVAVEANPALIGHVHKQHAAEIAQGRLVVVNAVLTTGHSASHVDFFVHRHAHGLSQFLPPDDPSEFEQVRLPAISLDDLISRHGTPWYFKSDVEGYDASLLRALFALGCRPPYISAEYHDIDVFSALATAGGYDAFKLSNQYVIPEKFSGHLITTRSGERQRFDFALHSSGPFGSDLPGPWMYGDHFLRLLGLEDLTWADIHATNIQAADPAAKVGASHILRLFARSRINRIRKWLDLRRDPIARQPDLTEMPTGNV